MDDYWFWVILVWALVIGVWLWSRKIEREIKAVEKDVGKLLSNMIFMRTEKHNDIIFAYDAMSGDFVCQGNTLEELNKNFGERYPNRRGVLIEAEETTIVL